MSRQFNDTTNYGGLVQIFEKEIGANRGDISGNSDKLKEFTVSANSALDKFMQIALTASGTWQFDDSNQTDYPIITTALVQGQRDYSFVTDGTGNLILDIYEVYARISATGVYQKLYAADAQSEDYTTNFTSGLNVQGVPYRYDKTANAIFLDLIPSYSSSDGLKVYINREASYFQYTDTTRKAGVPGILHDYFAIKPAYETARRNNIASFNRLEEEVIKYEGDEEKGIVGSIASYFGRRAKDEPTVLRQRMTAFR